MERSASESRSPSSDIHAAGVPQAASRDTCTFGSGSGSCPSVPHAIDVVGDQEVQIELGPRSVGQDACSTDISGHVIVLEPPEGIVRPSR
jgi:hypothetical protein